MASDDSVTDIGTELVLPKIRKIGLADLKDALAKGLDDFKAKPSHIFLLVVMYPILGFFLYRMTVGFKIFALLFPLIAGFALIGPLAAIGLYELSRQREQGKQITWADALGVFKSPSLRSIVTLSVLQMALYFTWLGVALAIYKLNFGDVYPSSIGELFQQVFYTPAGHSLIVIGCGVGFLFAVGMLAISAVSFPMLVDRNVGPAVAVHTSVRAVMANPVTMGMWGIIVSALLAIGALPLFLGLAITMPILGHATWHLYRKVVEY